MLKRSEKDKIVESVRKQINDSKALFVTNLVGVSANDAVSIRKGIREANGAVVITRNTLFKRASEGTKAQELLSDLKGPHAVAFAFEDAPSVAKVLFKANEESEIVELKSGLLGEDVLAKEKIVALAKLPSREEMLGTLLATFNAPMATFVRLLNALKEKKEQEGEGLDASGPSQEVEGAAPASENSEKEVKAEQTATEQTEE